MSRIEAGKVVIGDSLVIKDSLMKQREKQVSDKINDILSDAQLKANKILADAQDEANNIKVIALNNIQGELNEIKEQARLDGLEQGKQEIFAQFETQLNEKLEELTNFVDAAFVSKNEIIQSADREIIDIIMMISRKIFTDGLKLDDEYLLNYVRATIKSLKNKEQIKLIVNPEEVERLYNISEQLTAKIQELDNINIISDTNISPDCLVVESLKSRVYSNLNEELNEVENKLQKEYKTSEQTLEATIKQVDYKIEEAVEENTEDVSEQQSEEEETADITTTSEEVIDNMVEENQTEQSIENETDVTIETQAEETEQAVNNNNNDDDDGEFQPLILNEVKEIEVQEEIRPETQADDES